MDQATVKEKIQNPDFAIDEINWRKIKPAVKKARAEVSKEMYA